MPSIARLSRAELRAAARGRGEPTYIAVFMEIANRFGWLYRILGMDSDALCLLLRSKLVLHERSHAKREGGWQMGAIGLGLMVVFYMVLGVIGGCLAFVVDSPMEYMTTLTTLVFVMLLMPLLVDFSSILLDTSDIELLAPLPISDLTLVGVRITHLVLYLGVMLAALGLGPLVLGSFAYGIFIFVPVLCVSLLQAATLALAGVVILYMFALKTIDVSRFRDGLVYIQTGTFALFYLVIQVGPLLAERSSLRDYLADKPEYLVLLPTAAGGALWRLLLGQGEAYDWRILIAGVMVFLIAVGWAVFLARDGIVTQLVQLDSAGGKVRKRANRHGLTGRFGSRLAKGPMERAGWNFFLAMCSSDRVFKGRCLPLAATMIVPLAVLGLGDTGPELAPVLLPYVPYYLLLIVPLIWQVARFSEAYSGNWILRDMSHESLEGFTRGAMKASYIRFAILPIFLIGLLSVMSLDMRGILGFLLSASLTLAVCSWLLTVNGIEAPFTRKYTQAAGTNQMTVGLIAGSVAGVWGFMQYQLFSRLFYAPVLIIPAMGFAWFMWKRLNHASLPIRDGRR